MYFKGGLIYLFTGWRINAFCSALVAALHKPVSNNAESFVSRYIPEDSWTPNLISMALTGCIITLIMTPIDTLAIMALSHSRYKDFTYTAMCKKIVRKHGYSGFFFGLKPGLIGLIPHTVLATIAYRLLLIYNVIFSDIFYSEILTCIVFKASGNSARLEGSFFWAEQFANWKPKIFVKR